MIEVQNNKSTQLATTQLYAIGSVPVILPRLLPPAQTPSVIGSRNLCSLFLIVVMPTAFWCALINAVRSFMDLETGTVAMTCIALVIGGFLMIVRSSLMIDRSV